MHNANHIEVGCEESFERFGDECVIIGDQNAGPAGGQHRHLTTFMKMWLLHPNGGFVKRDTRPALCTDTTPDGIVAPTGSFTRLRVPGFPLKIVRAHLPPSLG